MGNVFSIICLLTLAVIFFIDYLKDKKVYRLLVTIVMSLYIFLKTPAAGRIGTAAENALAAAAAVLILVISYLLIKDYKGRKSSS